MTANWCPCGSTPGLPHGAARRICARSARWPNHAPKACGSTTGRWRWRPASGRKRVGCWPGCKAKQPKLAELLTIAVAQGEVLAGNSGEALRRLEVTLDRLAPENRPLALYWLGRSRLSDPDPEQRRVGMLQLLELPALYGETHPDLAAAGLYHTMSAFAQDQNAAAQASRAPRVVEPLQTDLPCGTGASGNAPQDGPLRSEMRDRLELLNPRRWDATPRAGLWCLAWFLAICLAWLGVASRADVRAAGRRETLTDPGLDSSGDAGGNAGPAGTPQPHLLDTIRDGGMVGLLILLLSMVSVGFMIEHGLTIRKNVLMPEPVLEELDQLLRQGQVDEAVDACLAPQNQSLVASVVLAGLERYRSSEFGFAEYKAAVEEAGEDQTGRLYRKTEVLGLIGSIAPMLGLMGTVLGMIKAFNTIAASGGAAKPDELAGGIGQALVTTLMGLVVAIPDDGRVQLLPQPHRFAGGRSRQAGRADHDAARTAPITEARCGSANTAGRRSPKWT
jgi:biopolymer transport protein ExbB